MTRHRSTTLPPAALLALAAVMAVGSLPDVYAVSTDRSLSTCRLSKSSQRQAKQWFAKLAQAAGSSRSMRPTWHVTHLTFAAVGTFIAVDAPFVCQLPHEQNDSHHPTQLVGPMRSNLPPPTTV